MKPAVPIPASPERRLELIGLGMSMAEVEAFDHREMWMNDRYTATVNRRVDGSVVVLSVRRNDRRALHDWRDMQRIKNEVAGVEVEAVELYPAQSRLMDTANQYYLWCLPPGERFPYGYPGSLADEGEGVKGSVQRALPQDWIEGTQSSRGEEPR
jgi:hypothetical protein